MIFIEKRYVVRILALQFIGRCLIDFRSDIGKRKKINNYLEKLSNPTRSEELNFIFQITDKEFIFEDVSFLINNKNLVIPNLQAKKQKNKFFFIGKIKNKNLNFKQNKQFIYKYKICIE